MPSSSFDQSPWHKVLSVVLGSTGLLIGEKLIASVLKGALQVLLDHQEEELALLLEISRAVKAIQEGPFNTGLIWLSEANEDHRTPEDRIDFIELSREKFIDAHGQNYDKFFLSVIEYHVSLCWLMACRCIPDEKVRRAI